MLPLVSSMTTTVIGWTSLSKKTSGCGLSLSNTSKSSCVRSGTRRFCASVTVAKSETTCVPDLKVGCWAAEALREATTRSAQAPTTRARSTCETRHVLQAYRNGAMRLAGVLDGPATIVTDLTGRIFGK